MRTSSNNSEDSLKKEKLKRQSRFFLQNLLPHTPASNSAVPTIHCQRALLQPTPLWAPGNILDFKALSCTQHLSGAAREAADTEIPLNRTHWRSRVHGKAGLPLPVISPLFQWHKYGTLQSQLPKYSLTSTKHLVPHHGWDGSRGTD